MINISFILGNNLQKYIYNNKNKKKAKYSVSFFHPSLMKISFFQFILQKALA